LFGPGEGNAFELNSDLWPAEACVSYQENVEMTRSFSEEEIKHALFQMDKNMAAGLDGFPIEFYQACWHVIKEDMIELFKDFFLGHMDIKRINYGIISLLPKTKEANKI
jgi:hypothetical protein